MRYREQLLIQHDAPVDDGLDESDAEFLMVTANSTASFIVVDEIARTVVTEVPTSATIKVENVVFLVGDQVQVIQDDDTELISNVDAIDSALGTITLADTPSPQLTVDSTVRKVYGTPGSQRKTMLLAGSTPRVNHKDWYWQGTLEPDEYSDLTPELAFRVLSTVVKTAGTKANSILVICDVVEDDCGTANA